MTHNSSKGFTIIETIMYVSIVTIVTSVLLLTVLNTITAYNKSESQQNIFQNAHDALSTIVSDARYAKSIYTPTTVFDADAGQLSFETAVNAPTGETTTFVDFYLDNGVIYQKSEGEAALALTSERAVITALRFTDVVSGAKHSVMVRIQGHINTDAGAVSGSTATIDISSTAALRGAY